MNELQIFNNPEFGQIRAVEINGDPWLVGKDVAAALGYKDTVSALKSHVDDEDKRGWRITTPSGEQTMTIINESGVYSLVFSSKLEQAKEFKHWVTSVVLPSIRRNGGYIAGQDNMTTDELMAAALLVAHKTIENQKARLSELTVQNQVLLPKAEYFDALVDRNLLTNFRETAKQLEVRERDFVQFLINNKYIYRDKRGKLMPYAQHAENGLFEVKECFNEKTAWKGTQTLVTPKGRETFRLLFIGANERTKNAN